MKQYLIASLAAGLLIVSGFVGCNATSNAKTVANEDLKRMDGTWTMVRGEMNGKPLSQQEVNSAELIIVGDNYTVRLGDEGVKKGIQKLDATKTPKQINAHDTEGPTTGENLGIYEFTTDGDFRVCFAATGKERPTEFVSTPDNGQFIHVWRRAK